MDGCGVTSRSPGRQGPVTNHPIPPQESIWAAGCVVARTGDDGEPEYLLAHRPRYNDWSLPKGKLNKSETFLDAALRETEEETGISVKKPRPVGSVGYLTKADNPKVVKWWLVKSGGGSFKPNSEVDKIKWVSFDKAIKKLTYTNDKAVLDRANDMQLERSAGTIHLVRHASAGTRDELDPDDANRTLDKEGRQQREAIRNLLMNHPITRIGSSNFVRCVETVQPLAERLGIPVEREVALIEGSHPHRTVGLIHDLQQEAAVLCTHGDVIGDLIGHLFAAGVPMEGPMAWDKGSIWTLRTIGGRVMSGEYTPPPDTKS